jgi:hypothetical protein
MVVGLIPLGSLMGVGLVPFLLGLSGDLVGFGFGIIILGVMLSVTSWLTLSLRELEKV